MSDRFLRKMSKISSMPYYQVPILPTGGKGYPEGSKVFYRLVTVREAIELANMTRTLDSFRYALEGIRTEGMDKEDLFLADFLYISLLRNGSSGTVTHFSVSGVCPHCGEEYKAEVPVENVYVKDFEEVQKRVNLEGFGMDLILERPRVRRYLEYLERAEKSPGTSDLDAMALPIVALVKEEEEWDGKKMPFEEAVSILETLPSGIVEEYAEMFDRSSLILLQLKCPKCGRDIEVPVGEEGNAAVIKPFRKR